METLKVWYTDFWPEWNTGENFITPILSKHFNVVLDQRNPDVLFHSIFNRMSDTPNYKCKKILILAENWRPSQFGAELSISFDPHTNTNYRLPLWQIYMLLWPELKGRMFDRLDAGTFTRFCSFTVSNPSNFQRNGFFQQMSAAFPGQVKSYGKVHMNDTSLMKVTQGAYWRDAKREFFIENRHKYSIAFENSSYPYYTTEKLMDAFLAGSLPLYWGDPKVGQDFNPASFINVGKLGNEESIELVRKMEKNEQMFLDMYHQPIFTPDQKDKLEENLESFEAWLINKVK